MALYQQDFVVKSGLIVQGSGSATSSTNQTGILQTIGGAAIGANLFVNQGATVGGNIKGNQGLVVLGTGTIANIVVSTGTIYNTSGALTIQSAGELDLYSADGSNVVVRSGTSAQLNYAPGGTLSGGVTVDTNGVKLSTNASSLNSLVFSTSGVLELTSVGGNSVTDANLQIQGIGTGGVTILGTADASATTETDGALVVEGGASIYSNLVVNNNGNFATATSVATDAAGSAFAVNGNGYFDGSIWAGGNPGYTGNSVVLRSGQGSDQADIFAGGILLNATAGTNLYVQSTDAPTASSTASAVVIAQGGLYVNKNVRIDDNTAGSSGSNGALVVAGGAYFGSKLYIADTTTSPTSTASNSIYTAGGVGIQRDLAVGGSAVITGNLTVLGTQTIFNSTSTAIQDPVIDIGTNPNDAPLTQNDGYNKGIVLHYYDTQDNHMFLGRNNTTGHLVLRNNIDSGASGAIPNADYVNNGNYAGFDLGSLVAHDATDATTTTTGALQVVGGAGIGGNVYAGGSVTGSSFVASTGFTAGSVVYIDSDGKTFKSGDGGLNYNSSTGILTTRATTATNIAGGAMGQIPYQTADGVTGFVNVSSTAGYVLTYDTVSGRPIWENPASVTPDYTNHAGDAQNIQGGAANEIPFQSAQTATTFSSSFTYDDSAKELVVGDIQVWGAAGGPGNADLQIVAASGSSIELGAVGSGAYSQLNYAGNQIVKVDISGVTLGASNNDYTLVLDTNGGLTLSGTGSYFTAPYIRSSHLGNSGGVVYTDVSGNLADDSGFIYTSGSGAFLQVPKLNINGNYSLPTSDGSTDYFLKTDGAGTVSWAEAAFTLSDGTNSQTINVGGSDTLTISAGSNITVTLSGSTYIIANTYSPTDTLDDVTTRGSTTTNAITVGGLTLSNLNNNGELLYTNGSGTVTQDSGLMYDGSGGLTVSSNLTVSGSRGNITMSGGSITGVNGISMDGALDLTSGASLNFNSVSGVNDTGVAYIDGSGNLQADTNFTYDSGLVTTPALTVSSGNDLTVTGGAGVGLVLSYLNTKGAIPYINDTTGYVTADATHFSYNDSTEVLSVANIVGGVVTATTLVVNNTATVKGDLYVDGTLYVQGQSLNGIDQISGSTGTFVDIRSTGTIYANTITATNLTVTGTITLSSLAVDSVNVTGNSSFRALTATVFTATSITIAGNGQTNLAGLSATNITATSLTITGQTVLGALTATTLTATSITVGQDIIIGNNATVTNILVVEGTEDSFSAGTYTTQQDKAANTQSGALQIAGGAGIGQNLSVGGYIQTNVNGITAGQTTGVLGGKISLITEFESAPITTTGAASLDVLLGTLYKSAKYFVQLVDATSGDVYISEITLFWKGSDVWLNEYGISYNNQPLGAFTASTPPNGASGAITLTFTPDATLYGSTAPNITAKVVRTAITV